MRRLFFIFMFLILLTSSCSDNEETGVEASSAFVGGEKGISFSFVNGAPFGEFVANQNIPIKILSKCCLNIPKIEAAATGRAYDLYELNVSLSGLDIG